MEAVQAASRRIKARAITRAILKATAVTTLCFQVESRTFMSLPSLNTARLTRRCSFDQFTWLLY